MGKAVFSGLGNTDLVVPKIVSVTTIATADLLKIMSLGLDASEVDHVYGLRLVVAGGDKPKEFYDKDRSVIEAKRRELLAAIEAYYAGFEESVECAGEIKIQVRDLGESPDLGQATAPDDGKATGGEEDSKRPIEIKDPQGWYEGEEK